MGINLIEALQKWDRVTNDGGKTIYSTNKDGTIVMHRYGAGGGFKPTLELFNSTGWTRAEEPLILPEKVCVSGMYFTLNSLLEVYTSIEGCSSVDTQRFSSYNYYPDKALAQYIADKNLIQRINIVLGVLNKDNPNKEMLISKYIRDNYTWVIDRIRQYEEEEGI